MKMLRVFRSCLCEFSNEKEIKVTFVLIRVDGKIQGAVTSKMKSS